MEKREREGITILACRGRLVLGDETERFRATTLQLIQAGQKNLILYMPEVDYIDSSGLGSLVSLAQTLKQAGGQAKLVSLNEKNTELLVITKLSTLFEFFDDEQEAVNSFFPDRKVNTFDLLTFVQEIKEGAQ